MVRGWHKGERAIQEKLGYDGVMSRAYTWIEEGLPEEHKIFHMSRLQFLPLTILDDNGRPWGSVLVGKRGEKGFVGSPSRSADAYNVLTINAEIWDGDPMLEGNQKSVPERLGGDGILIAGIGIELMTRRRNKFAGKVVKMDHLEGGTSHLEISVNQAIGNCPKYINIRELVPYSSASPHVVHRQLHMDAEDRLPSDVIAFIHAADTAFLGTSYAAPEGEEGKFPSHLGMNHRGGRPGFIRVRPSDGRTVVLPDYSGNRLMTSLGNIEITPSASLTFIDFNTGSVLYLTGFARTALGPAARHIMPRQNTLTMVHVTGFVFVENALPLRQSPNTVTERSPYSPPIRLLAEEGQNNLAVIYGDTDVKATLTKIEIHSPSIAKFTWELSMEVDILPGQAAIMDFTSFVGPTAYQHMAPSKPTALNDDRIRTWTVSSAHARKTKIFSLTMKEKPGGVVTGALFAIARRISEQKPDLLVDTRPLDLSVRLVGISGEFTLSKNKVHRQMLWIAGGIGITPFLSFLSSFADGRTGSEIEDVLDIVLVLSTHEPEVLLPLVTDALREVSPGRIHLRVEVFTARPLREFGKVDQADLRISGRRGRFDPGLLKELGVNSDRWDVYICGPDSFERAAIEALEAVGVEAGQVKKEGFAY